MTVCNGALFLYENTFAPLYIAQWGITPTRPQPFGAMPPAWLYYYFITVRTKAGHSPLGAMPPAWLRYSAITVRTKVRRLAGDGPEADDAVGPVRVFYPLPFHPFLCNGEKADFVCLVATMLSRGHA